MEGRSLHFWHLRGFGILLGNSKHAWIMKAGKLILGKTPNKHLINVVCVLMRMFFDEMFVSYEWARLQKKV